MVVLNLPCVQLQDQTVRAPLAGVELRIPESLVLVPSVTTDAPEESLVPAAGGLNVTAVDEGLGAHGEYYIHAVGVEAMVRGSGTNLGALNIEGGVRERRLSDERLTSNVQALRCSS